MNRRQFVGSLGLTFALPQLECFGNVTNEIKRLAVVYVPNGINMEHWTPKNYGDVIDIPNTLSPLENHLNETQIISGLIDFAFLLPFSFRFSICPKSNRS